jgi:DNA-binding transcriptional LysR family regulator
MIDNIQALIALSETGTVTKAASKLHLSQSAVTKRIQNLEFDVGYELIERSGRNVVLTSQGLRLLQKARPIIAELNEVIAEESSEATGAITMTVSESVLYSWGAKAFSKIQKQNPNIELIINSHSSRIAIDKVRSGEQMLTIAPGKKENTPDLDSRLLIEEPMVIIPSGLSEFKFPKKGCLEVISSEKSEATWPAIQPSMACFHKKSPFKIKMVKEIQSFAAVLKMAESGFGHGLLPIGVVRSFKIPCSKLVRLPAPGIKRPISIIGRPTTLNRTLVKKFTSSLGEYLEGSSLLDD